MNTLKKTVETIVNNISQVFTVDVFTEEEATKKLELERKNIKEWVYQSRNDTLIYIKNRSLIHIACHGSFISLYVYALKPPNMYTRVYVLNYEKNPDTITKNVINALNNIKTVSQKDINKAQKRLDAAKAKKWVAVKTMQRKIPQNTIVAYTAKILKKGENSDILEPNTEVKVSIRMKVNINGVNCKSYVATVDLDNEKIVHKSIQNLHNEKQVISEIKTMIAHS